MKVYGGVDAENYVFVTSALVGDEWSASQPGRLSRNRIYSFKICICPVKH
jgi:hypothetical protein